MSDIEKTHKRLSESVAKMRAWQKSYFKYRSKQALEKSKYYERQVDSILDQEKKEAENNQGKLF